MAPKMARLQPGKYAGAVASGKLAKSGTTFKVKMMARDSESSEKRQRIYSNSQRRS